MNRVDLESLCLSPFLSLSLLFPFLSHPSSISSSSVSASGPLCSLLYVYVCVCPQVCQLMLFSHCILISKCSKRLHLHIKITKMFFWGHLDPQNPFHFISCHLFHYSRYWRSDILISSITRIPDVAELHRWSNMSSAYSDILCGLAPVWMPLMSVRMAPANGSIANAKSKGDSRQPCAVPRSSGKNGRLFATNNYRGFWSSIEHL